MNTLAETIGTYASTLKYEDLPSDVVHQVKRTILDTLGCALGGYTSEPCQIALDMAAGITSKQPATVLYGGQKTSLDLAVFANGIMIRYLDFCDGYISVGSGRASDSIAALISSAEVTHSTGRELIVVTAITYEVFCRICDVMDNKSLGIDHVTIGGIASVVGASRILGLTRKQIIEAINIMVAGNVTLNQIRVGNVSKWKACAYAHASRNAIFIAQLAARGMTGPSPIFEGRDGFFKVVSRHPFELTFGGNGEPFRIMRCHLKRFPLGNFSQTVVTAALEARSMIKDYRDIAGVHVRTTKSALGTMADSPEKWHPRNRETADHSMPYTTALALMYGTIDEHHFDEEYLCNPELLELMGRIKCSALDESKLRESEINPCELEITLRSGESRSVNIEYHRGHWRNPMSDAEVDAKFRSLAGKMLPATQVDGLLQRLWKLEDLSDVQELVRMTVSS